MEGFIRTLYDLTREFELDYTPALTEPISQYIHSLKMYYPLYYLRPTEVSIADQARWVYNRFKGPASEYQCRGYKSGDPITSTQIYEWIYEYYQQGVPQDLVDKLIDLDEKYRELIEEEDEPRDDQPKLFELLCSWDVMIVG